MVLFVVRIDRRHGTLVLECSSHVSALSLAASNKVTGVVLRMNISVLLKSENKGYLNSYNSRSILSVELAVNIESS